MMKRAYLRKQSYVGLSKKLKINYLKTLGWNSFSWKWKRSFVIPILTLTWACCFVCVFAPPFCHICLMYHISGQLLFSETVFMTEILQLTFRRAKGNILISKVNLIENTLLSYILFLACLTAFLCVLHRLTKYPFRGQTKSF